jgi:hypothetical protein
MSPLRPVEDLVYVIGEPPDLDEVGSIGHQPTGLRVIAPGYIPGKRLFSASSTINCRYRKSSLVPLAMIASGGF